MTLVQDDLNARLPRTVEDTRVVSAVFLTIAGESWWLTLCADWTLTSEGAATDLSVHSSADETAKLVLGRELLAVRVGDDLKDPVFEFSGGLCIVLLSDVGEESWVMSMGDLPYRVVG